MVSPMDRDLAQEFELLPGQHLLIDIQNPGIVEAFILRKPPKQDNMRGGEADCAGVAAGRSLPKGGNLLPVSLILVLVLEKVQI